MKNPFNGLQLIQFFRRKGKKGRDRLTHTQTIIVVSIVGQGSGRISFEELMAQNRRKLACFQKKPTALFRDRYIIFREAVVAPVFSRGRSLFLPYHLLLYLVQWVEEQGKLGQSSLSLPLRTEFLAARWSDKLLPFFVGWLDAYNPTTVCTCTFTRY